MLVLSFQTSFFFCLLVRFVILLLLLLKAGQEVFGKRNWTGSHKDLCSWVTVLVSCFSLCLPIDSHLPYDLSSLIDIRSCSLFSRQLLSSCLRPHGLWHSRFCCSSPSPGVYSNPCPLSQWWHPMISSSVSPFSFCPQSFPALGSIPMSLLFP